ncbi:MAG: hypothetical protein ACTSRG_17815 [Candidatus Helarchaeota archaeon]
MAIELNKLKGLKDTDAKKLRDNGITNIASLACTTVNELSSIGIKEDNARSFIEKAGEILNDFAGAKDGFISGEELLKQFDKREILSTKCPAFDNILDGGFETQKVYEVYGKQGSGKSSLMLQLACIAQLPQDKGGLSSPAIIYIDTEGAFSIKRIKQMAVYYGLDPIQAVKNILRAAPPTSDALLYLVEKSLNKVMEESGARLIVLDSIATHFRSEYGDVRQLLPQRQRRANRVIHALKKAVTIYNALAILTNQVTANPSGFGAPYQHSMGYTVGHESQIRIRLAPSSKGKGIKKITIEKAVDLPNEDCEALLNEFGLVEVPAKKKDKKKKDDEEQPKEITTDKDAQPPENSNSTVEKSSIKDPDSPKATKPKKTAKKSKKKAKT